MREVFTAANITNFANYLKARRWCAPCPKNPTGKYANQTVMSYLHGVRRFARKLDAVLQGKVCALAREPAGGRTR